MTEQQTVVRAGSVGFGGLPREYAHWGAVPWSLATRGQLTKGDLPREPGGPVRARVAGYDWRGKEDSIALYAVSESVPTKASASQLAAAQRRRTATVRVCGDCGANSQRPVTEHGEGRHLCPMCAKVARVRDFQARLGERRAELAAWAQQLLADEELAVVWVSLHEAEPTPSGRRRPPLAARVQAVDHTGRRLVDALVRLAGPRTKGAPEEAVPAAEGAQSLRKALVGRRVLCWTSSALEPVTERLMALGHPVTLTMADTWESGSRWDSHVAARVAQWRGELDPTTGQLLTAWEPGTADRLHLLLQRMAARSPGNAGDGGSA